MTYHPQLNDQGSQVLIKSPSNPTSISVWSDPTEIATVIPGRDMPPELNRIAFTSWQDAHSGAAEWQTVQGQMEELIEPEFVLESGNNPASGVVIVEPDSRIWVSSPTNSFGGYANTFPKGVAPSTSRLQSNAIKAAYEKTGLKVVIIDFLCDSVRSNTATRYYLAKRVGGNPADMGWKSQAVHLVPSDKLREYVTHPNDQPVIDATLQVLREVVPARFFASRGLPIPDEDVVATKSSWGRLHPMPERHITIQLNFTLDKKQGDRVKQGFIPAIMEEKWFAYFEDNVLFQHRSWTGFCIDQIHFIPTPDGGLQATHAKVNREPRQYLERNDNVDITRITRMVQQLASLPPGAKSKAIDPMVAAFELAMKPYYLGSPDVVSALVGEYLQACINSWNWSNLEDCLLEEENSNPEVFRKVRRIFSGKNPEYTLIGTWHSTEELGSALIKYCELDSNECEGESLGFIVSEALWAINETVQRLLEQAYYVDEDELEEAEYLPYSAESLGLATPHIQELHQFLVNVFMGTNTIFLPDKTLSHFRFASL